MNTGWDRPPDWLVDRIEREIRRGLVLVRKHSDLAGFALEAIRFSMYLGGQRHVMSFDREGRRAPSGVSP